MELDATGGTDYSLISTTQMMSVPYALYAENAGIDSTMLGNMVVSTFGDTLTLNGQSIIIPGISFSNVVPTFGSVTDIDGNTYQTVSYGGVEWMTENLTTTTFSGTEIPLDCNTGTGGGQPGWCYYNEDISFSTGYGKLYNGHTIASDNNLPSLVGMFQIQMIGT